MTEQIAIVSVSIALFALLATSLTAWSAYSSFRLNRETQKIILFTQLQQQYEAVSSRFPSRFLDPNFRAERGSQEYESLRQYWMFCFVEWYATNRLNPRLHFDLWENYVSRRILDAMDIPSLRDVLLNMIEEGRGTNGDVQEFYGALMRLAASAGKPFKLRAVE